MDGHLPFLKWSPTNPRMVTQQNEVYYKQTVMDGHLPSLRGSPTDPGMLTHQPKDGYHICPCLAWFDTIWPGFPMFDPMWFCFALFRPVWPWSAPFGPVFPVWPHPHLALVGPVGTRLPLFGHVWHPLLTRFNPL